MSKASKSSSFPFSEDHDIKIKSKSPSDGKSLLGYPHIFLQDTQELYAFLSEDLCIPTLEKLAPRLWWMSKQSSAHISPLHHQAIKLRQIVLAENPELHLIWHYDRIFIKPIPKYLFSHAFWREYLLNTPPLENGISEKKVELIKMSALGYLRTYYYLVKHESDFEIALEKRLIPQGTTWEEFSAFKTDLKSIKDSHVSPRYHYGEIRLSRLNFYVKILLGRSHFCKVHGQYKSYFARFYGPLLFVFGMATLLLSALQVELAVEPLVTNQWPRIWDLCRGLALFFTGFIFFIMLLLLSLLTKKVSAEWYYAFRDRSRRRRDVLLARKSEVESV